MLKELCWLLFNQVFLTSPALFIHAVILQYIADNDPFRCWLFSHKCWQ